MSSGRKNLAGSSVGSPLDRGEIGSRMTLPVTPVPVGRARGLCGEAAPTSIRLIITL